MNMHTCTLFSNCFEPTSTSSCTKRLLVNFKSSVLIEIIYKCKKNITRTCYTHLQYNTNKFTSIKVIKTYMYRHKVIKNAKLIKAWNKLKLIIVLDLVIYCQLTLMSTKQGFR